MPTFRDLTGQKFGRLLVQFRAPNKGVQTAWQCLCDCGNTTVSTSGNLTFGKSTSCGCGRTKHGHTTKRNQSGTYQTWRNMIRRCTDPNNKDYKNYGARGITVCERWLESFDNFLEDMGERPKGLTLDRKNNNGSYCPENCEWATRLQQCHNRRNSKMKAKKMKQKTFTCTVYTDPGHGWFKVKRSVLHNLGIADKISSYSYQRGEYVYLEEDCDAFELHQALKQQGTTLRVVEKHTDRDSRIRSYERYRPLNVVDIPEMAVPDSEWQQDGSIVAGYAMAGTEANGVAASSC